ncbi:MAG TPA: MiaB/RimO family radical SAM methylthiotransferase [Terriglobales bacterium]|nr:MiaB/RimO family radical SAM methylthiotransferase [Terriglobales bacterium]
MRCYYSTVASFYVQNFGCRATQADGAAIEHQFEEQGLERAGAASEAQIVVLNTCTVTASADQDARAAIRRVHRENPGARIVVTGCYAQRSPEELAALPGVAQVIGNSHKHQLAEIAASEAPTRTRVPTSTLISVSSLTATRDSSRRPTTDDRRPIFVSDIFAHTELLAAPVFDAANERTRPNLKIQDGCDNRCSFCVIPFVRGQSRSMKTTQILHEVNALVAAGYRELVISGINLGRWGRDLEAGVRSQVSGLRSQATAAAIEDLSRGPTTDDRGPDSIDDQRLVHLVRAILEHTPLEKLRISSVEPMDWTDELIDLVATSPRIAKHAHVPMQSGSDAVLRRMHRKYRPWHYREKIEKIRAAMPTAAIGADVMVGFPGETDTEFEETRRMIEDLPFTYLHVFTYSARPGTPAADMPRQVPVHVARDRNRIVRELAEQKKLAFMRSFIGKTVEAITLTGTDKSRGETLVPRTGRHQFTEALTDNYLKLQLQGKHVSNLWIRAKVSQVQNSILVGTTENCDLAP